VEIGTLADTWEVDGNGDAAV